jgi:ketosteroid isomerase-like protein
MPKLCAVAVLALVAALLKPATARASGQEEKAIRNELIQWTSAFNEGNTGKICGLFAPELRYDYRGYRERGFEDVCALLQKSLNDRTRHYSYSLKINEILVSGDLAVARLVWTLKTTPTGLADQTVSEEQGMDIFRKQANGDWKIIRYIAYEN